MAEQAKKDNKNLIIGICAAVAVVVVIVIAVVLGTKGGSKTIDDSYFVSDGTKYVYTVETEDDEDEYVPAKTHMVYYYSGDKVTGAKAYYEYASTDEAKAAYDALVASGETSEFKNVELNGKYVVLESKEEDYKDRTVDDVKQEVEFMEMLKNMGSDTEDETEDEIEEDY